MTSGPDLVERLADLFRETGRVHHQAFIATAGHDPEWPLWYAEYLQDRLGRLLNRAFTKSELVYFLVMADKEQSVRAPGADWPEFYATLLHSREGAPDALPNPGHMSSTRAPTPFPPIFDGHNDTILSLVKTGRSFFDRSEEGHLDLPRAREGGLGGGFFAVYIHDPVRAEKSQEGAQSPDAMTNIYGDERTWPEPMPLDYAQSAALSLLGRLVQIPQASNGAVEVVRTAAELQHCLDSGVFAMLLHFEGAEPLDPDGHALETFYAAGLRSVGLTHSRRNRYCKGVPFKFPHSPDTGDGLTDAGKALVRQLNRRRVMIDLSHINERGFWDVAAITDAPLVATHSNAYALSNSPRNLTDRQLDAIRESRGVAGLNFSVGFLREDGARNPDTPLARMVEHISYMAERMGIDCVALGSDFDGTTVPAELKDAAGLPRLMGALEASGYSREDLRKLAHGNWVRVLRDTWGG